MTTRTLATLAAIGTAAAVAAACCGSMKVDDRKLASLSLPVPAKALDQVHDAIAAKAEGKLYAGAAEVDITTDLARGEGIYLGGFDMGRKNKGVRDPVYAHVLYLDDGKAPFVLVTLDTIGYMSDDAKSLRARISDRWADNVVVAAVHNHVGPDTVGYWGPACLGVIPICGGRVPEYMEAVQRLVASAVDQAARSARPARLRTATAQVDPALSLNIHPQIRQQKDDLLRLLLVEGEDGAPIASVANWGCHIEAMWNDDQLSADWAGVYYDRMRKDVGGVPLFIEGALGGLVTINPGDDKMATEPEIMDVFLKHMSTAERVALRDRVGNSLADTVQGAAKAAGPAAGPEGVTLHAAHRDLELPASNWVFEYMGNRKLIERKAVYRKHQMYLPTELTRLQVRQGGRALLDLQTMPGEPAPTVVADLDALSGAPVKFTVALGNDEVGYIVREADWDLPQYEYERTMSLGKTTATTLLKVVEELKGAL